MDFTLGKICNLLEKHSCKLKMLFILEKKSWLDFFNSPFVSLQVHCLCNKADEVWGEGTSVSLDLRQQCSQASQIQLFSDHDSL